MNKTDENLNVSRRDFVRRSSLAVGSAVIAPGLLNASPSIGAEDQQMIWGNLLHLSYNMWCDRLPASWGNYKPDKMAVRTFLELEKHSYDQIPTGSNWDSPENFGNDVFYFAVSLTRFLSSSVLKLIILSFTIFSIRSISRTEINLCLARSC